MDPGTFTLAFCHRRLSRSSTPRSPCLAFAIALLLVCRVNREEVPISAFDLLNPDALSWDFDIPAFTLLPGAVFNLPLGVPLVPNSDVWSQAFVDITGSTSGFRVLDAQEHQHIPEPAPLVMVFAGLLVMLQWWRLLRPAASRASARSH